MDDSLPADAFDRADRGERVELLTLDEASYRVGGFIAPRRPGVAWDLYDDALTGPVFDAARARMLERGLATQERVLPEQPEGMLSPAGEWKQLLDRMTRCTWPTQVTLSRGGQGRGLRLTPALPQAASPWLFVETMEATGSAGDDPLPIRVELVPLEMAVAEIADAGLALVDGLVLIEHARGRERITVRQGAASYLKPRLLGRPRPTPIDAAQLRATLRDVLAEAVRRSTAR